ncbi:VWA domain-containing protein [Pseudobacteroides cellulosolvens]|uniref:von Willebrand factor type A n=1 Tax=Pseudobacteroides cellulosolvens ATCC 35603 = DSM 2933 TaxID=398512 RepID=A0A0L6JQW3_9FIRM|nr:VWA domain-containing protein [Pseudobacteroides cellulosolvens]KNY28095.1 von Willebrand factor type A [Pseudobacteroides cellulosolvens ATCC 35603 = DSM 2933]
MKKNTLKSFLLTIAISTQLFNFTSIVSAESVNTTQKNDVSVSNRLSQFSNKVGSLNFNLIEKTLKEAPDNKTCIKAPIVKITEQNGKALLSWEPVEGAKFYNIKRGNRPGELVEIASNISENEYTDTTAVVNRTYYYSVTADDISSNESPNSNILLKLSIPQVPVLFGGWENGSIRLRWTKSTDQEGYAIYRSTSMINTLDGTSSKGPYILLGETLDNEFTNKNVDVKSEYYYIVRAYNSIGQSGSSYELKVSKDTTLNNDFIPYLDSDEDEIRNEEELYYGTEKDKMDTDSDGLSDGYEVNISGTDPTNADNDGDGILDGAEMILSSNPCKKNTMQDITKFAVRPNGSVEIVAKGKDNLAVTPVWVRVCKNMQLNAVPGIIGSPYEAYIGNLSGLKSKIIFNYNSYDLGGVNENSLCIFKVDTVNKKLVPVKGISLDKIAKTVSCSIQSSGIYLLGNNKMPTSYGKLDIVFAMDDLSFINGQEYENKRLDFFSQFLDSVVESQIRFGILDFSNKNNFNGSKFISKKAIMELLKSSESTQTDDTVLTSDETNLTEGLMKLNKYFEGNNTTGKAVILFTGKKNTGDKNQVLDMANVLAKKNIKLFPMSYGQNADKELLQAVANATRGTYFNLDNDGKYKINEVADQLKYVLETLAMQIFPLQNILTQKVPTQVKCKSDFILKQEDFLPKSHEVLMERCYSPNFLEKPLLNVGLGWRTSYESKISGISNIVLVKADNASLIEKPSKRAKVVGTLRKGETLKWLKTSGKYVFVEMQSGRKGYIASKDVQLIKTGINVLYSSGDHSIFQLNGNKLAAPPGCTDKLIKTKDGYELIRKDNLRYKYESLPSGKLILVTNPKGSTYKISYKGEQISSIETAGDKFGFTYNSDKSLQCIYDNNDFAINYKYGPKCVLDAVYDTEGNSVTYSYDRLNDIYKIKTISDASEKETYIKQSKDNKNAIIYNYIPDEDMGKSESGIGILSEKYESRGAGGAACIANNPQDAGGKSYGAWQLASKTGSLDAFLKWLRDDLASNNNDSLQSVAESVYGKLSDAKALDNGFGNNFDAAWKEIALNGYQDFLEIQSRYIKLKYYDRADAALKNYYGFDISQRSRALRSVLFSTSVQHGTGVVSPKEVYTYLGSVPIFRKALESGLGVPEGKLVNTSPGTYDFSKITDEEIINAVYDDRSKCMTLEDMQYIVTKLWGRADASKVIQIVNIIRQVCKQIAEQYGIENLVLYHFSGNGPDVQSAVYRRLSVNERADALRMLQNPRALP